MQSAEEGRAIGVENNLQSDINQNEMDSDSADNALQGNIDQLASEATASLNALAALEPIRRN